MIILRPDIAEDFRKRAGEKLSRHCRLHCVVQNFASLPDFYERPPERIRPLGTIHAVLTAAPEIDGPFAVLNADDFYGADAYIKIHEALGELKEPQQACMVAYPLKNTVSANGSVTRGVCTTADGALRSIRETHEILLHPDGSIRSPEAEGGVLDGNSLVSMNFWGFTRETLQDMESYFHSFLRNLGCDLKKECLLPDYVADRIQKDALDVRVLRTEASWFGMTYPADRIATAQNLHTLIAKGVYPQKLFE